jgi:hypothetical protein
MEAAGCSKNMVTFYNTTRLGILSWDISDMKLRLEQVYRKFGFVVCNNIKREGCHIARAGSVTEIKLVSTRVRAVS